MLSIYWRTEYTFLEWYWIFNLSFKNTQKTKNLHMEQGVVPRWIPWVLNSALSEYEILHLPAPAFCLQYPPSTRYSLSSHVTSLGTAQCLCSRNPSFPFMMALKQKRGDAGNVGMLQGSFWVPPLDGKRKISNRGKPGCIGSGIAHGTITPQMQEPRYKLPVSAGKSQSHLTGGNFNWENASIRSGCCKQACRAFS